MLKAYAVALILSTSTPASTDLDGAKQAEQLKPAPATTQLHKPGNGIGF